MSDRSIKRLRHLIHLNQLMFERQARAVDAARAQAMVTARDISDVQAMLSGDGIVSASFSNIALRRAARLRQEQARIEAELSRLLSEAVETRAAGAGIKSRLEATVQQQGKAAADMALQEMVDRIARKRNSSL